MEQYMKAEMEIIEWMIEDVITTSMGETPVNQTVVPNNTEPSGGQGDVTW